MRTYVVVGFGLLICLSGCGLQIGTPDYWEKYNQAIRGQSMASLERLSQTDREELNSLVRRVGK